jgi:hypothetical protein
MSLTQTTIQDFFQALPSSAQVEVRNVATTILDYLQSRATDRGEVEYGPDYNAENDSDSDHECGPNCGSETASPDDDEDNGDKDDYGSEADRSSTPARSNASDAESEYYTWESGDEMDEGLEDQDVRQLPIKSEPLLPPPSQSHFAKFESADFTPDDNAPFESEFARLASSQQWAPGTKTYIKQRTIALVEELRNHYFSQPVTTVKEEPEDGVEEITSNEFYQPLLSPHQCGNPSQFTVKLETPEEEAIEIRRSGYQALCREVGIDPPPFKIGECRNRLKNKLVNIVDLIDAQRTGKSVKIWKDFYNFRKYTLQPGNRIDRESVKGTELASLLQDLRSDGPGRDSRKRGGGGQRVRTGRVRKR